MLRRLGSLIAAAVTLAPDHVGHGVRRLPDLKDGAKGYGWFPYVDPAAAPVPPVCETDTWGSGVDPHFWRACQRRGKERL
jgi:hypothetical protein